LHDIHWGHDLAPLPTAAGPAPEWSSKRYPESGRDSHLRVSIDDAVRAAENDQANPRFNLWKLQNPGWQPIGFFTGSGGSVDSSRSGQTGFMGLTLSAPFGERIVQIQVHKAGDAMIVVFCSCDYGEDPSANPLDPPGTLIPERRRFDPAWLPPHIVTLGTADKFWADLTNGDPGYGSPNDAAWGYNLASATDPTKDLPSLLDQVRYGSMGFDDPSPLTDRLDRAYAIVDVSTGHARQGVVTEVESLPATAVAPLQAPAAPLAIPPEPNAAKAFLPIMWGAATASLTALLLTLLLPWAKHLFVGLYSKLRRENILDHTLRDQLVTLIEQNPGISQPLMQSQTRAGWSTLTYHLSILSSKSIVTSLRDGRHRRYFRTGAMDHGLLAGQAKLGNAGTRRVFDVIRSQPGIDRATLTRLMGLAKSSVSWHLDRLKEGSLVRTEPRGRRIAYFAADPAATADVRLPRVIAPEAS
jgi:predicted transcriptional regulator